MRAFAPHRGMFMRRAVITLLFVLVMSSGYAATQYRDKAQFVQALNQQRSPNLAESARKMISLCEQVAASSEEPDSVRWYARYRLARLLIPNVEQVSVWEVHNFDRALDLLSQLEALTDAQLKTAGIDPRQRSDFQRLRAEAERLKKHLATMRGEGRVQQQPRVESPPESSGAHASSLFLRVLLGEDASPYLYLPRGDGTRVRRVNPLTIGFLFTIIGAFLGAFWRARRPRSKSLPGMMADTVIAAFIGGALINLLTLQIASFFYGSIMQAPRIAAIGCFLGTWTWMKNNPDARRAHRIAGLLLLGFALLWGIPNAKTAVYLHRMLPVWGGPVAQRPPLQARLEESTVRVVLCAGLAAWGLMLIAASRRKDDPAAQRAVENEQPGAEG